MLVSQHERRHIFIIYDRHIFHKTEICNTVKTWFLFFLDLTYCQQNHVQFFVLRNLQFDATLGSCFLMSPFMFISESEMKTIGFLKQLLFGPTGYIAYL